LRDVPDASIPVFMASVGGVAVDLVYVQLPPQMTSTTLTALLREAVADMTAPHAPLTSFMSALSRTDARAFGGLVDTRCLLASVGTQTSRTVLWRQLVQGVRLWAKTHGVYSARFGYLGTKNVRVFVCAVLHNK
jgi:poly(A) polymerase Pap1